MSDVCYCDDMFDCCDCGGNDCGCSYCWSCNACERCLNDDDNVQLEIGQTVHTTDGLQGEIIHYQDPIVELKLTNGDVTKRYVTQIKNKST